MTFDDEASRSLMCILFISTSAIAPHLLLSLFCTGNRLCACVCVHGAYPLNTTSIFWHVYISLLPTNPKFVTRIKNRGDTCHWWNWWFLLDCFGSVQSTTSCVYRLCGFGEQKAEYLTKWELCETPHTHTDQTIWKFGKGREITETTSRIILWAIFFGLLGNLHFD